MKYFNHFRKPLMFGLLTGVLSLTYVLVTAVGTAKAGNTGGVVPFRANDAGSWGLGSHECGTLLPVVVETTGTANEQVLLGSISLERLQA